MNYAVQQRLRLIDFVLYHYGYIQRETLMDFFAISMPQASRDLRDYREHAPGNCVYNATAKRWERSTTFQRLFE